jgi:amino acid permease
LKPVPFYNLSYISFFISLFYFVSFTSISKLKKSKVIVSAFIIPLLLFTAYMFLKPFPALLKTIILF